MSRFVYLSAFALGAASMLTSCKLDVGLGDAAQRFVAAAGHIENASKELDPAGIKKLLDQNAELKDKLEEVLSKYRSAMGAGALEIGAQSTYFRIKEYTGQLSVQAQIDNDQGRFLSVDLTDRARSLGFNAAWILFERRPRIMSERHPDYTLQDYANSLFSSYLAGERVPPQLVPSETFLNNRFGSSGVHSIKLTVTPQKLSPNNQWHIVWELVARDAAAKSERSLATYTMNSGSHGAEIGKAYTDTAYLSVIVNQASSAKP